MTPAPDPYFESWSPDQRRKLLFENIWHSIFMLQLPVRSWDKPAGLLGIGPQEALEIARDVHRTYPLVHKHEGPAQKHWTAKALRSLMSEIERVAAVLKGNPE